MRLLLVGWTINTLRLLPNSLIRYLVTLKLRETEEKSTMHAAWIYLLVATATASPPPIISTALGNIHGSHCDHNVKAVFYKGIPYAEPPVDELRFAAPRAYSSRYPDGVLNATTAAPSCIQFGETFAESGAVSENWSVFHSFDLGAEDSWNVVFSSMSGPL